MKILFYSFEAFGELKENPAFSLCRKVKELFNSREADLIQLPVTYDCWDILREKIEEFNPDYIIGFGVLVGLKKILFEKIGLNYIHANTPDNKGNIFHMKKIDENKELALETDVDLPRLVEFLQSKDVDSEVSFSARTYVFNYAYFKCLSYIKNSSKKTFFIHVPDIYNDDLALRIYETLRSL